MKQKYLLAIDQGTTSSRSVIYDLSLNIVAMAQKEFTQYFPKSGWVEQDPEEIWQSVQSVISDSFISSGIHPEEILGIGISNQRETTIVWDKNTGKPIHKAVVWQSRQSATIAEELINKGYEDFFQEKTGLVIDAYFSATKIRWLLDNVPFAQEKAERGELLFGTIDTWLLWKFTAGAVHVTDYTNASRTMLFNTTTLKWDEDILKLLNIPKAMLPEVKSNAEVYGKTKDFHFYGHEVPISGMAGDQQAALIGQMAFEKGETKSTYGTGAFIVMNTGDTLQRSSHKLLSTIAYQIHGKTSYALEGSIFVAGSAIQWLRDGLKLFDNACESEKMAQSSKEDSLYIVPAFTGLGAPYWDSDARGAMFGLTRSTSREDITKATLEAIAYQVKDILVTMEKDTQITLPRLKVDGGAANNQFLLQFQADLLDIPVIRPKDIETTSLGAALLAGIGIGLWENLAEVKNLFQEGATFTGKMSQEKKEKLYLGWQNAVKACQTFRS